jgi:transcriptional regulator with XRE-family HTH domain
MQRFGKKLQKLRERKGLSQEALAALLGFSRSHLSKLEQGVKTPHARLIIRLADIFEVTADQLMRDELEV